MKTVVQKSERLDAGRSGMTDSGKRDKKSEREKPENESKHRVP
ncbi:MAG: hypothetical protein ACRD5Z_19105 [Bryobacteraceae bacterium]